MVRRGLSLCLSLSMASLSFAGAQITLVPTTPGPYALGAHVSVDIMLSQVDETNAAPRLLRMAGVDLSDSSAELNAHAPVWALASLPGCGGNANCAGYYFDSDLTPATFGDKTASMAYYFQDQANLGPNANAQISVPASGQVRIGTLDVMCPNTAGNYNLNVVNSDAPDQNTGAVIYWGFGLVATDPVRVFRAGNAAPNNLFGGTLSIPCGDDGIDLLGSSPASCTAANGSGSSLWRSANNFVLLDFSGDIAAPGAGQIEINEIMAGGAFGANLNTGNNFAFSVVNDGNMMMRRLRIQENGTVLGHRKWYAFRNTGGWGGVNDFSVKLVVHVGDTTNDARVLAGDVSAINACVPCVNVNAGCAVAGCGQRNEITGDNRIIAGDVSQANSRVPSVPINIPGGHTCP